MADRFTVGDPLRGLAALSVVLLHVLAALSLTAGFAPTAANYDSVLTEIGRKATQTLPASILLLFCLSGFLIARPFAHALVEDRAGPPVGRYVRNRVLRIVPLLWFMVAALLIGEWVFGWVSVFAGTGSGTSLPEALALFGFMQNATPHSAIAEAQLGSGWTLHVELVFYLLIPVVAAAVAYVIADRSGSHRRSAALVGLCLVAALGSLALVAVAGLADPHDQHWFVTNAYGFMPGVALAVAEPLAAPWLAARGPRRWQSRALLGAAVAGLVAYAFAQGHGSVAINQALGTAGAALLLAACLVKQWSGDGAWVALDNRGMRWVGVRSYSVYLVHGTVIALVYSLADGSPRIQLVELAALTFAGTLALSAVTYRFVEQPFLRRRHHVEVEPRLVLKP